MKKLLSILLASLMLLTFGLTAISCQQNPNENETGSTENNAAASNKIGKELLTVGGQLDALNGLKKGDADMAIIDSVMAGYYMNTGDTFADYQTYTDVILAEEQYGIGAAKGNKALMSKINEGMIALVDTQYKTIAETYGLTTELLVKNDTENPYKDATDSSWDDVVASKKLVIGITLFAPIAYMQGDGAEAKMVGFDIDLAKAVIEYLNTTYNTEIEIEFTKIDWNQKETLLANGTIDLVWNGMTINAERQEKMTLSVPYLANKQVAVIKKADAEKYAAKNMAEFLEKAKDAVVIVEKGSAGETVASKVED